MKEYKGIQKTSPNLTTEKESNPKELKISLLAVCSFFRLQKYVLWKQ